MRGNNVLGIIFAYVNGSLVPNLTQVRTMGSVPFAGRYRLIDFPLSNMVNSGINKVGVIPDPSYNSLMDHLGSGKAWNLSRKREGLYILPPSSAIKHSGTKGKIQSLSAIKGFLQSSIEEYVLLSDSDTVCNIAYSDAVKYHIDKNADITVIYHHGNTLEGVLESVYTFDPNGKALSLKVSDKATSDADICMRKYIIKRELLIDLVDECQSRNILSLDSGFMFKCLEEYNVFGYEFKGKVLPITSLSAYFNANMALTNAQVRNELFNPQKPIYTKVRDEMPAKYGLDAKSSNSLIANGCIIDGEVENCIIFRGVKIGAGCKIKNSVIMQDTVIGNNSKIEYVVCDKDVVIEKNSVVCGTANYHTYIEKGSVV